MLYAWDILILLAAFSIFMLCSCYNVRVSSEETREAGICIATSKTPGYLDVAQSTIKDKEHKQFNDLL
jgi:hypothetical protein